MKIYISLLLMCVFLAGCSIKIDQNQAKAKAATTVTFSSFDDNVKKPNPDVVPGKCKTCNGTGKVGDGKVFSKCRDCDGTGVVKAASEAASTTATEVKHSGDVFFYTLPGCIPCQRWKNEELNRFVNSGIKVHQLDYPEQGRLNIDGEIVALNGAPFFLFYVDGKKIWHHGFISLENFENILNAK